MRLLSMLLVLVATLAAAPSASAQPAERCFPETGFCIAGQLRAYWERNGGLPVFGYPIGPQHDETVEGTWTGPVQWFERDRLEDHGNEGLGILAGRLGARSLELRGRPWSHGAEAPPARATSPCRFFPETGYNVCNLAFRIMWEQHGGLERFGYPLTPAFKEQIEGRTYTVQYFERRRMELHPENAGTSYEVLLGLLGRDIVAPQRPPSNVVQRDPALTGILALTRDFTDDNLNLVRVGRDGTGAAIVNGDSRPNIYPAEPLAWAPDGSAVAFINANSPNAVLVLSADGRDFHSIVVPAAPNTVVDTVDWAPGSARLLVGMYPVGGGTGSIGLLSLTGELQLIGEGERPRWLHDSSLILFERPGPPDGASTIMVMRGDGSDVRELAVGYTPRLSPDGARLAFGSPDGYVSVVGLYNDTPRRLAEGLLPVWSPDGSRIAYVDRSSSIVVAYADGGDPRIVFPGPGPNQTSGPLAIYWSPDSAQLAFRYGERMGSYAGVINLDGSGLFRMSGAALPPLWRAE